MISRETQAGQLLEKIRTYTREHKELRDAHHFLFNLVYGDIDSVRFVIIGQNPGMSRSDSEDSRCGLEESNEDDFRMRLGFDRLNTKWASFIRKILPVTNEFVQTERFFWSSRDLKSFKDVFKTKLHESPHLKFCRDMNVALIKMYEPKAVVCLGFGGWKSMQNLYSLTHKSTILKTRNMQFSCIKLVSHFVDSDHRNWFFTPNPTGSFGFSEPDKAEI